MLNAMAVFKFSGTLVEWCATLLLQVLTLSFEVTFHHTIFGVCVSKGSLCQCNRSVRVVGVLMISTVRVN